MYPASDEFHTAVANGNEQMALLIFGNCVFTSADINVSSGITFNDNFSVTDDLSIGQTLSNSVSFTLFNDSGLLNNYRFGTFTATLGVLLGENNYQQSAPVVVTTVYSKYVGDVVAPYLTRGGTPVAVQPSFPVASLLAYDNKLWAFSSSGQYAVYNDKTGENITANYSLNKFMREKVKTWEGKGIFYNKNSRMLMIYEAGIRKRYEFVPLGVFLAERPSIPDTYEISLTCYDQMQLAECDMPTSSQLGITYPTTIGTLFSKLCNYMGVTQGTKDFLNKDATISSEPDDFKNSTIRTVIGWIAEAACANARFDRDGKLCLDWVNETTLSLDENNYATFEPYWYTTKKITKLYVRDTNDSTQTIETISGSTEDEHYLIQDNPLLKG